MARAIGLFVAGLARARALVVAASGGGTSNASFDPNAFDVNAFDSDAFSGLA